MRRLLALSCLVFSAALPAFADGVLQKARAMSQDGPVYTFNVDVSDTETNFAMTVDPSKPEGNRVTKISPAPSSLKGDAAKRAQMLQKRTEGDIWCNRFMENIPATAKRIAETGTTATFSFTPLPGRNDGQMGEAYKYLTGSVTIDKSTGGVLRYEIISPRAFKPAAVAKVDRFSMKVACKPAPDGRTHIESLVMDLKGSALMKPFEQKETRRVSNLQAIPAASFAAP
ncbi:MAG: hypothetical protein ACO33A_09150 [Hyphomonas sp.]